MISHYAGKVHLRMSPVRRAGPAVAWLSARAGQAAGPALSYGGIGVVVAWLAAVLIYAGMSLGDPRRVVGGTIAAVVAAGVLGYAGFLTSRAVAEDRAGRKCDRPGERVIGLFGATLMQQAEGAPPTPVEPVTLIATNQRLVLHPAPRELEVPAERDLATVVSATEVGPAPGRAAQQRVLVSIEFEQEPELLLRMSLSTAHEFREVAGSHMTPSPRRVRAVVMDASGPTPSKPDDALADILESGKPVLYQFVLAENYLRIIGDRPQPMADLWWYFHWEHMRVCEVDRAELPGVPEGWRCLRLTFHEESSMVVCGLARNIERLRQKAANDS